MQFSSRFLNLMISAMTLGGGLVVVSGEVRAAAPTGILLSPSSIAENAPLDTLVGTLTAVDVDPGDTHVFELVGGPGDENNLIFLIDGNQLYTDYTISEDFEAGPLEFSIRMRVKDSTNKTFTQVIRIELTDDVNEDADGDGLTQAEEVTYGTSDLVFDSDGDGVGDGAEVAAGTSPTVDNDWPQTSLIGWGKKSEGELAIPTATGYVALSTGENHSLARKVTGEVVGWGGLDSYGQITVPAGLGDVVQLAAGGDFWRNDSAHSVALRRDGTVVGWGYQEASFLNVPAGLNGVVSVDAGRSHAIALRNDGTVKVWGYSPFGSVEPAAELSDIVAVSAGGFRSLALKSDGTVMAWGKDFDGSAWVDASVPVGLSDVVAVSAGRFHSLALKSDGTVVAWGLNSSGQTNVPAGLSNVVAVAAGGFHSLALKNDGSVIAWGMNSDGQVTVPGSAQAGVKLIAAGLLHSLAVRQGVEFPAITSAPVVLSPPGVAVQHQIEVSNPGGSVLAFSAMGLPTGLTIHPASGLISGTVAAVTRRSVRIRVETAQGVLSQALWFGISNGSAPTSITLTPPSVRENSLPGSVVGILSAVDPDTGDSHTFEWVDGEGAGDNGLFRIEGNQVIVDREILRDHEQDPSGFSIRVRARDASLNPVEQVIAMQFLDDLTEDADGDGLTEQQELALGTSDTKKDTDGDGFGDKFEADRGFVPSNPANIPSGRMVLGWGAGGDGRTVPPLSVGNFIDVSAGGLHSLALGSDGTVAAWGGNNDGQATLPEVFQNAIAVEAGGLHSLVLRSNGTVAAWGNNNAGQTDVPVGLGGVVAISAGAYHNLALRADGTVVAWGYDQSGQSAVPADLTNVVAVAAGGFHSLALKSDGTVVAWGSDWEGVSTPPEGLGGVIAIAAGGYHSLALKQDGTVVAWGFEGDGQVEVPAGLANVTAISAGWRHSLALRANGTLSTWGDGSAKQTTLPAEAIQIRRIEAGDFHNLAIRQNTGFPEFADVSPVRSWPGDAVANPITLANAAAANPGQESFSAKGLPTDLVLDPVGGLITGVVTAGEQRAVRIAAETNQGTLSRVIWFDTSGGVAPTGIGLSANSIQENSPAGTVVGSLSVVDPNAGDVHVLSLEDTATAPDSFRFVIVGNQLVANFPVTQDFEAGQTVLKVRVVAVDSGNNAFGQDFVLQVTNDRTEDNDGDGISQEMEEDIFGTSDATFDNLNTADADNDGVSGVIEYAFNLNPKVPGPPVYLIPGGGSLAGLPAISLVTNGLGQQQLRMEYLRRSGDGMIYTPQFAGGLGAGDWQEAAAPSETPAAAGWVRCVVVDSATSAVASRRFGRVAVRFQTVVDRSQDGDEDGISQAMEEDVFGTSDAEANDFASHDLDQDGTPGMIEYAFNLDPKLPGPPVRLVPGAGSLAGLPAITVAEDGLGNQRLRIEYLRRVGGILTYVPQFSGALGPAGWETAYIPVSQDLIGGEWERCIVEDTQTVTSATQRFARVAVMW